MNHRTATPQDADRVVDILFSRAEWLDSKVDVKEGLYQVCDIDNETFATYRLSSKPEKYWDGETEAVYLSKLAVAKTHSGRKLGREIMKQIEKNSFTDFIRLDCVTGSTFLTRFYQGLGYRFIRTVSLPEIELDLYELNLENKRVDSNQIPAC